MMSCLAFVSVRKNAPQSELEGKGAKTTLVFVAIPKQFIRLSKILILYSLGLGTALYLYFSFIL